MTEEEAKNKDEDLDIKAPEKEVAPNIQERPAFFDDWVLAENKDGTKTDTRIALTAEQKGRMNENIVKLGKIFEGSDIRWQLDGALNISLYNISSGKGDYIGTHKDIDLSVEDPDLEKLETLLSQRGYGLFLSHRNRDDPTKRNMEQVSAQKFREAEPEHYMIAAIDSEGKIREDESLKEIDVHLIKRDQDGNPIFERITLPKKWFEAQPIDFEGQKINLSQPARVAFFKLHSDRSYDRTDLIALARSGNLSIEDVDEIEQNINNEASSRLSLAGQIIDRVSEKITLGMSPEQIFEAFAKDPMIAKDVEKHSKTLHDLSQRISEGDCSKEEVKSLTLEAFKIEAPILKQKQKVKELRSLVEDAGEIERSKKELEDKF